MVLAVDASADFSLQKNNCKGKTPVVTTHHQIYLTPVSDRKNACFGLMELSPSSIASSGMMKYRIRPAEPRGTSQDDSQPQNTTNTALKTADQSRKPTESAAFCNKTSGETTRDNSEPRTETAMELPEKAEHPVINSQGIRIIDDSKAVDIETRLPKSVVADEDANSTGSSTAIEKQQTARNFASEVAAVRTTPPGRHQTGRGRFDDTAMVVYNNSTWQQSDDTSAPTSSYEGSTSGCCCCCCCVNVNDTPASSQIDSDFDAGAADGGGKMTTDTGLPPSDSQPSWPSVVGSYIRSHMNACFEPSDNRLAMKLFGNRNALMRERQRQRNTNNWVIHPCSDFRFYWDLFMLITLLANLIILPIAISFFNDDLSPRWIVFNSISDTLFLLDLIINFRTGIIADKMADEIILDPRKIALRYLRTWFFLDLVSSLPLDYIILLFSPEASVNQLVHAGRALRFFRLVKLLSLVRLLRLSRLVRYFNEWQEFLSVAGMFMRIFNLICMMLLIGHWNGCLQYLIPMMQDFPANSWVAINELQRAHWTEQYTWALFKALSHMLCIGYGRYPPMSTTDVWLTMASMLTGATCYALFVGHSTTLIQSFDTSKRLYREKFKQVEEYMAYRKLPRHLRQRISDYYEHRYHGKMFDEKNILGELNECLKEEIINYNCRALVASVPFFSDAEPAFVSDVVTKLEYEVFQPGAVVIREGTVGTKMYFIQEGVVAVVTKSGEVAATLSEGCYFGEICLLTNARRVASVRAETYCNLFSLSVDHFRAVLDRYPEMRRTIEAVAAERLHDIGCDPAVVYHSRSSAIDDDRSSTFDRSFYEDEDVSNECALNSSRDNLSVPRWRRVGLSPGRRRKAADDELRTPTSIRSRLNTDQAADDGRCGKVAGKDTNYVLNGGGDTNRKEHDTSQGGPYPSGESQETSPRTQLPN